MAINKYLRPTDSYVRLLLNRVCIEQLFPKLRALSIQPKIPVISVGTSNGTDHFGLVGPEYSGPP